MWRRGEKEEQYGRGSLPDWTNPLIGPIKKGTMDPVIKKGALDPNA